MKAKILSFSGKRDLLEGLADAEAILLGAEVRRRYGLRTPVFIDLRTAVYTDLALFSLLGSSFAEVLETWSAPETPQQVIGVPDTGIPQWPRRRPWAVSGTGGNPSSPSRCCGRRRESIPAGSSPNSWAGRTRAGEASLIDDVVASGGSLRRAVIRLKELEIPVGRIVVCVDREQGGVDALADLGVPIYALFSLAEIGDFCRERKLI